MSLGRMAEGPAVFFHELPHLEYQQLRNVFQASCVLCAPASG